MKLVTEQIRLAATDLSNHLACRHVTTLDLQVARGEKRAPDWAAPDLVVIRERGERHERAYLTYLKEEKKLRVENLAEIKDEKELLQETRRLMEQGADVIAQGALAGGEWFGRPDVLRRGARHGAEVGVQLRVGGRSRHAVAKTGPGLFVCVSSVHWSERT